MPGQIIPRRPATLARSRLSRTRRAGPSSVPQPQLSRHETGRQLLHHARMRCRATAATARGDDVDPEAGLSAAGGVSAAVVLREQLDILVVLALVVLAAIHFVLDAVVREVNLAVEIRQIVLARPLANLVLVSVRAAIAIRAATVVPRPATWASALPCAPAVVSSARAT
jgi:hypothetical protein